jgi:hypothetical protein
MRPATKAGMEAGTMCALLHPICLGLPCRQLISAALTAAALACFIPPVAAEPPRLDSREYKLMLEPAKFSSAPQPAVDQLWNSIKRAIADRLDRQNNGDVRHDGEFKPKPERFVVFRDTGSCVLDANGYSLRERLRAGNGKRELTLKFRSPDIFLAAQSWIANAGEDVKFEEDIAPLTIRTVTAAGERATFAQPPTMRSLFSQSATQEIDSGRAINSLPDLIALYRELGPALRRVGVGGGELQAPLLPGQQFRERVFSGAEVDLGENADAEFDISLWYGTSPTEPELAELSFKYKLRKGDVAASTARRAMTLFTTLQQHLGDWASPAHETKTKVALPGACRG